MVAWAGWAFLTATITLEVLSRLRRIPTPHLPALALPQSAARGLVGAAVLLFAAGPALPAPSAAATPLVAATAPARTTPATPALAPPTASHQGARATRHAADDQQPRRRQDAHRHHGRVPVVDSRPRARRRDALARDRRPQPRNPRPAVADPRRHHRDPSHPAQGQGQRHGAARRGGATYTVRAGDTLSEIAEDRLGDADRYPQIFAASRHTRQADGRHLRDPDLILPGWRLTIPGTERQQRQDRASAGRPAAARGPRQHRPRRRGHGNQARRPRTATNHTDHRHPPRRTPQPRAPPAAHGPSTVQPDGAADRPSTSAGPADDADAAPWLLAGLAGGPVLAGSLWMLLRRRRAEQTRHRRPGRTIATPPPVLAPVEKTLATVGRRHRPDRRELVDEACAASPPPTPGQPADARSSRPSS